MEEAPAWLDKEKRQAEEKGEDQVESGDEIQDLDIIEVDVAASTQVPPSTQADTSKPSSWRQIDDVGPSSGKPAMTFSHKRGRGH